MHFLVLVNEGSTISSGYSQVYVVLINLYMFKLKSHTSEKIWKKAF